MGMGMGLHDMDGAAAGAILWSWIDLARGEPVDDPGSYFVLSSLVFPYLMASFGLLVRTLIAWGARPTENPVAAATVLNWIGLAVSCTLASWMAGNGSAYFTWTSAWISILLGSAFTFLMQWR